MRIRFTDHARIRMKQRGITRIEVMLILKYPEEIRKSGDTKIASGFFNRRKTDVVFIEKKNYINILTVI